MHTRRVVALILQILAVLFSFLVWIDPLEGGAALIIVMALAGVAWLVGLVPMPKWIWISALGTAAIGVAAISLVLAAAPPTGSPEGTLSIPPVARVLLDIWPLASFVVISGMIAYAVWIIRVIRENRA